MFQTNSIATLNGVGSSVDSVFSDFHKSSIGPCPGQLQIDVIAVQGVGLSGDVVDRSIARSS